MFSFSPMYCSPPSSTLFPYTTLFRSMFISRVLQSDLMLLLARTTPVDKVTHKTDGLSVFLVDIRGIKGLEVRPLRMMIDRKSTRLNSSHLGISYAVFCLKKKNKHTNI